MNTRKTVIFIVDNGNQIYAEFKENATMGIIRTFVRDTTRLERFEILYNGVTIKNDNLKLKRLFVENQSTTTILFHVKTKDDIFESCEKCKEKEIIIEELIKEKNQLCKEINEMKEKIENMQKSNEALMKENSENSFLKENVSTLIKKYEELKKENEKLKINNKSIPQKVSENTINNEIGKKEKIELEPINTISAIDFDTPRTLKKTFLSQSAGNIHISNKVITFSKFISQSKDNKWYRVFSYLNKTELLSVSIINKKEGINVIQYMNEYINEKNKFILKKKEDLWKIFEEKINKTKFILSRFSTSALKVLNNETHLKFLETQNEIFINNPCLLDVFKVLLILSQKSNEAQFLDENSFISQVKQEISSNTKDKKIGLGDYIHSLISNFVFTRKTIEPIMNIKPLDSPSVSKFCKTTGILSFIINDALLYIGFPSEKKKQNSPLEHQSIFELILEQNKSEFSLQNVSNKLEVLLTKYK